MTIKNRLTKLEKAAHVRAPGLSWKRFIQCDDPEKLPPDLREKWKEKMKRHERGMSTLAGALTEITGQETTQAEAEASLTNLKRQVKA
jgi:hypothetical protein